MRLRNDLRRWQPWYECDRVAAELHQLNKRTHGLMLLVALLAMATVIPSIMAPRFSLAISIAGGLVIIAVITTINGQWRELRDGLQTVGGIPPMLKLAHIVWLLCLEDVKHLAQGGRHHEQHAASREDTSGS